MLKIGLLYLRFLSVLLLYSACRLSRDGRLGCRYSLTQHQQRATIFYQHLPNFMSFRNILFCLIVYFYHHCRVQFLANRAFVLPCSGIF